MRTRSLWGLLALLPLTASAVELLDGNLAIHGFGTLAATRTTSSNVGYRQFFQPKVQPGDWSFNTDSLVAMQVDLRPNEDLSGTVQVVATTDHTGSFSPRLEWALIKYDLTPALRLSAGRLLSPTFMQSEYRFARYAFSTARVSQQLYAVYPLSKHNGFSTRWTTPLASGNLGVEIWGGREQFKVAADDDGLGRSYNSDKLAGAVISWESPTWLLRGAYASAQKVKLGGIGYAALEALPPALRSGAVLGCLGCAKEADAFERSRSSGATYNMATIGARGRFGAWTLSGELAANETNAIFGEMVASQLTIERRFNDWVPYLSVGTLRIHGNERGYLNPVGPAALQGAIARVNTILDGNDTSRDAFAAGVRWDVMPNMALKAEVEHFSFKSDRYCNGTSPLTSSANCLSDAPRDKRFNLLTLSADFAF